MAALEPGGDKPWFLDRNVRVIGGAVDGDPLLILSNALPLPPVAIVAARRFTAVAEVGMAHADEDRSQHAMRFGVAQGGNGAR
jgi:hypothetical protein